MSFLQNILINKLITELKFKLNFYNDEDKRFDGGLAEKHLSLWISWDLFGVGQ